MTKHGGTDVREKKRKLSKKAIVWLIVLVVIAVLLYPFLYSEMLNSALDYNDENRVRLLLKMPGDVNYRYAIPELEFNGSTALEVASAKGNYEMMELLLEEGALPSTTQGWRQPLEYVLGGKYEGMFERVKLLVEAGADVNVTGNTGFPAIYWMLTQKYEDPTIREEANAEVLKILKYLVEHGASVQSEYSAGGYLTAVVENENYGVLEYLFDECGLDVNGQNAHDETALIRAAELGNLEMVDFLLRYGADTSIHDKDGKTAYDYAIENGHTELAELLKP